MRRNKTIHSSLAFGQNIDYGVFAVIGLALLIRVAWLVYTNYTEEDAFITFRFAQQIAEGHGFVFNSGEPMYGTTTPLLTLLLSIWYALISEDLILGARIVDLLAINGALLFLWKALRAIGETRTNQLFTLLIMALSSKLWLMDTQGMEMPLVLFFMTTSWYLWVVGKIGWAGVMAGLLLWTRIDLIPWVSVLAFAQFTSRPREAIRFTAVASLTYAPWVIFSVLYFGSPIPQTILAKWVAYSEFNTSPLSSHLMLFVGYLSIFEIVGGSERQPFVALVSNFLAGLTLGLAGWQISRKWQDRHLTVLAGFAVLEIIRLTLTRETFFNRYFVPTLWVVLILAGLALGTIWSSLQQARSKKIYVGLVIAAVFSITWFGAARAQEVRVRQMYRHEASLQAIGLWLHERTPQQAKIQLEPLGYIGYYSNRNIIDEVGLVTPKITELKRERVNPDIYFSVFQPDYLVIHCDDALRLQGKLAQSPDRGLAEQYQLLKSFNPLNFDPHAAETILLHRYDPRTSCYEIWQRLPK